MTLTEFLLARIVEDEAAANLAVDTATAPSVTFAWLRIQRNDVQEWSQEWPTDFTPARALAECEAKRRIAELHDQRAGGWDPGDCRVCGDELPCPTLRIVALPYADHPDYRDEWRP